MKRNFALIAIGVMAYIFADITHEAIGHGLACIFSGGKVTLLTSVYFRSETHSFVTDAFGPLANLSIGVLIGVILSRIKFSNFYMRLLLLHTMAFNLFWFAWMCLYGGSSGQGDLSFYFSGTTEIIWRVALIALGFVFYAMLFKWVVKLTKKVLPELQTAIELKDLRWFYFIPYFAAGVAALVAVLFYQPFTRGAIAEALVFPMYSPILFIPPYLYTGVSKTPIPFKGATAFTFAGIVLFVIFCATMGRGLHF